MPWLKDTCIVVLHISLALIIYFRDGRISSSGCKNHDKLRSLPSRILSRGTNWRELRWLIRNTKIHLYTIAQKFAARLRFLHILRKVKCKRFLKSFANQAYCNEHFISSFFFSSLVSELKHFIRNEFLHTKFDIIARNHVFKKKEHFKV